jgi:signal transduction histidine kinase
VRVYWLNLAGVALVSLLAAAALGVALARWVARPLRQVQDAATEFGAGNLDVRGPTDDGPPEVRRLATSFNATASQLQQTVTAREQFVADASHQLRTPLAALRLRLENVQEENAAQQGLLAEVGADTAFLAEDLDAALAETDRLTRIVDGLLALARAERADPASTSEPIYLAALLDERVATWEPLAREREVEVESDVTDLRVQATRDRLTQVLDNLLANAIEVAPAGSTVRITVGTEPAPAGPAVELSGPRTQSIVGCGPRHRRVGLSARAAGTRSTDSGGNTSSSNRCSWQQARSRHRRR